MAAAQAPALSVNWPAQLEGSYPLNFVALGRVVRVEDTRAAMHIEQYEFRPWRMEERPAMVPEEAGLRLVPHDSRNGITRTGAAYRPGAWPPLRAV